MADDYILETRNLVKEFKGFVAVNDVCLKVQRGRIHALIGPNGAGKTTVFNLLTKFLASSGTISTGDTERTRPRVAGGGWIVRARKHQGSGIAYGRKRALEIVTTSALEPERWRILQEKGYILERKSGSKRGQHPNGEYSQVGTPELLSVSMRELGMVAA